MPIRKFEMNGGYIESGHYVIVHDGAAVVVYCCSMTTGRVSVQFMCSNAPNLIAERWEIEAMLVGAVGQTEDDRRSSAEVIKILKSLTERMDANLPRVDLAPVDHAAYQRRRFQVIDGGVAS